MKKFMKISLSIVIILALFITIFGVIIPKANSQNPSLPNVWFESTSATIEEGQNAEITLVRDGDTTGALDVCVSIVDANNPDKVTKTQTERTEWEDNNSQYHKITSFPAGDMKTSLLVSTVDDDNLYLGDYMFSMTMASWNATPCGGNAETYNTGHMSGNNNVISVKVTDDDINYIDLYLDEGSTSSTGLNMTYTKWPEKIYDSEGIGIAVDDISMNFVVYSPSNLGGGAHQGTIMEGTTKDISVGLISSFNWDCAVTPWVKIKLEAKADVDGSLVDAGMPRYPEYFLCGLPPTVTPMPTNGEYTCPGTKSTAGYRLDVVNNTVIEHCDEPWEEVVMDEDPEEEDMPENPMTTPTPTTPTPTTPVPTTPSTSNPGYTPSPTVDDNMDDMDEMPEDEMDDEMKEEMKDSNGGCSLSSDAKALWSKETVDRMFGNMILNIVFVIAAVFIFFGLTIPKRRKEKKDKK